MEILFEDNHIIAVNKSNSEIVQGDKTGDEALSDKVKAYIKEKYNKPGDVYLGVVHRIDRPVSGVVLFARTSKAATRLSKMFLDKEIKKTYWALVKNLPEQDSGKLVHYLIKNQEKNRSSAYDTPRKKSKEAILNYTLISSSANYHMLEINLETGRHHQIRCQLAKIGCPIRGDLKYGAPRSNKGGGISLHAKRIEFEHPVKKEWVVINAPVPKEDPLWREFENVM
ncbi:RluA family pseudouridine synthase [Saccharicrinis fermentans]|uniref:Ribosomal large subunit pseudouridine synthase D n=1 Tax=Saccharicrinis fermentans DSM 9555 = JCM 21142 TaxID=869213 RepID=W7Y0B5_9BACT|nr:RNA pseudouridine synthase [Saccharicrinis fermentans]GAF04355.1 ribosomal large subunit pseudouridine synthase D [Saccharicrinis fermentans DSM 9555 = JCM 21142]